MIRSLLKRTKFHRAALPLLAMLLTTTSAWADVTPINVSYMKADGSTETHEAIPLDGNETTLSAGWYVVNSDITYDHKITISSAVTIILANGKTMNVGTSQQPLSSCYKAIGYSYASDNSALTIYGQSLDDSEAGHLNVYCANCANYYTDGISLQKSYTQHSGNVSINAEAGAIRAETTFTVNGGTCKAITTGDPAAIYAHDANITGGTIVADGGMNSINASAGNVTISGGKITATNRFDTFGSIYATNITLGWTNPDDYIKSNNYYITGEGHITIADGKMLFDSTDFYSGTLTNEQKNAIAGKTLRPAASVSYVNADGTMHDPVSAIVLSGTETKLPEGWYVVNSDITYDHNITIGGDVTIILANGKTMNVGTSQQPLSNNYNAIGYDHSNDNSALTIYGQSLDDSEAGHLNVYYAGHMDGIWLQKSYTQHSGNVSVSAVYGAIQTNTTFTVNGGSCKAITTGQSTAINANDVNITGGTVVAEGYTSAITASPGNVTISGGKITATNTNTFNSIIAANVTLGWTNASDYIRTSHWYNGNITIAPGRKLTDGTNVYSGVLSSAQVSALQNNSNKLTPKEWIWEGDGSETTPYQITDSDDLLLLGLKVNQGETYEGKYFKLTGDIKFDRSTDADNNTSTENNFIVIGDAYLKNSPGFWNHKFQGHFDGNNKTISGIRIYKGGKDWTDGYVGLFGYLEQGAVVKDLTITDCRITGHNYTGGIVGNNSGGTITNCHVDNTVYIHAAQDGACYHGGIAGNNYSNEEEGIVSTISNCTSKVQLTVFDGIDISKNSTNPTTNYGGIVGVNSGTLTDNYVEGATIPQVTRAYGGIVGQNDVSGIRNYYKECTIAGVKHQTNMACGDPNVNGGIDVTYRLVFNGKKIGDADALTLQISGTGAMADYSSSYYIPWYNMRSNITDIAMSDGVTTIGKNAFLDCANLASIKISSDVKTIGERAFMHCWALTDVTIPASVESIGNQAFADCETLKTIHMKNPDAPTLVADFRGFNYNFAGCDVLEGILTPSAEAMNNYASAESWRAYKNKLGIEGYCGDASVDGGKNVTWMMTQNGTVTVDIYKQENDNLVKIDEVDVPAFKLTISGTGAIANYADINDTPWMAVSGQETDASQPATFYTDKKFITALEIGAGVTDLGTNAINGLRMLKSLTIADGSHLTTIAFDDFRDCELTKITLPETVTQINLNNDPNNLYYAINNKAWRQYRSLFTDVKGTCGKTSGDNLTWALTADSEPDTDGRYPLTLTISGTGAMADYDNPNQRAPWGTVASVLSLPEGLTYIGNYAFYLNEYLTTVAIPASVETIGCFAFDNSGLNSVTFAENCKLTTIGGAAFYNCRSLSSIAIPASVVTIGDNAFMNCSSLASVTFAENCKLTTIDSQAFQQCTTLEAIDIPATVTAIGYNAFLGCSALKTVRLNRYVPSDTEHPLTTLLKEEHEFNHYLQFDICPLLRGILVPEGAQSAYQQDATWQEAGYTSMIYDAKKTLYTANTPNQWMTWCSDIEYFKPENCTVYTVSGVNSEQVQVAEVEGDVIPAYTPVLIKRAESELESDLKAEFSNVKEPSKENGWNISSTWYTLCDNNGITPTYGYNSISYNNDNGVLQADAKYNNNYSIFFYGNTGAVKDANTTGNIDQYEANYVLYGDKLMLVDTDNGIPVNRCVLKVSYKPGGAVCARSLTIGVGGDTTGMEELKNEKIEELNSEWYDLQGRKLGSKPTRKGLYINNGKKIVIK